MTEPSPSARAKDNPAIIKSELVREIAAAQVGPETEEALKALEDQARLRSQRIGVLSTIVAVFLVILLVIFFFFTVNNVTIINDRIASVKNGPYPVSISAGRVETLLVQIRTISVRAVYNSDPASIESIRTSYDTVDGNMAEHLNLIAENFSTDDQKANQLIEDYATLRQKQADYIVFCLDQPKSAAEIRDYFYSDVEPYIQTMLTLDVDILDDATSEVDEIYEAITSAGASTVIGSFVIMAFVLVSLGVFLVLLSRRRHREIELRQHLEQALKLAQSANVAKSTFLSNMSHDIRTPMNAIVGLTSIARSHLDDTDRVRYCLDRITLSSKHLLDLINDILDMSKIESGKMVLNNETFSLGKLIDECVAIVQSPARAKHLDFVVEPPRIIHDRLQGDRMRLNQVFINLLSNAIKYTPEGGSIRFSITENDGQPAGEGNGLDSTSSSPAVIAEGAGAPQETAGSSGASPNADSGVFCFVVSDTGIGMDEDFLKKVFDPFERDYNEVTSFTEGTGLGLAITKNIIDLMGGIIHVESSPHKGTVFTVEIPFTFASDAIPEVNAYRAPDIEEDAPVAVNRPTKVSGRVLLVEDNALNREIAYELISEMGAEVDIAKDGVEAVERVDAAPNGYYQIIFMDWQMPRMDGIEATRTIISHEKAQERKLTPIIAMTANAFNEDRAKALDAGMEGFMTKPINIAELRSFLSTYLTVQNPQEKESR